nr:GNAT family N-acetyltransferase [uncultured Desulfuromonas sp.]
MKVRRYKEGEEQNLWSLLYETVHRVNCKDYSLAQLKAWAPAQMDLAQWKERLSQTNPFVAEENGQLIGFAELEEDGHIDCFYCAHNCQGQGVGTALLRAIEQEAAKLGISRLFAEASITAKGFFERHGFSVEAEQSVSLRGEQFTNFVVAKTI